MYSGPSVPTTWACVRSSGTTVPALVAVAAVASPRSLTKSSGPLSPTRVSWLAGSGPPPARAIVSASAFRSVPVAAAPVGAMLALPPPPNKPAKPPIPSAPPPPLVLGDLNSPENSSAPEANVVASERPSLSLDFDTELDTDAAPSWNARVMADDVYAPPCVNASAIGWVLILGAAVGPVGLAGWEIALFGITVPGPLGTMISGPRSPTRIGPPVKAPPSANAGIFCRFRSGCEPTGRGFEPGPSTGVPVSGEDGLLNSAT